MGIAEGELSLITDARQYIKRRYHKPGNVYLGVVSRLDALASGVVLFARTSKAAARLTDQFRAREVTKIYWAVTSGTISPPSGTCIDWMVKSEAQQRMLIVDRGQVGAQEARLSYRTLSKLPHGSLLEIELETGRKHQIRLQLAERGFPILGDRKYGSQVPFCLGKAIALHARRLVIRHPVRRGELGFVAPLPAAWQTLGVENLSRDEGG